MLRIRRAADRGHARHGWLDTHHTFSFASYQDPEHVSFRSLRVMNEDRIAPGQGFGTHPHRDMEILTYVLAGALEHRDSLGNGEVIHSGEFQRMSAGTGVTHSEFNPSPTEPVHLYQIWLLPRERGIEPSYEQKLFPEEELSGQLRLVASPDGSEGSLRIHQDARVHLGRFERGESVEHALTAGRHAWLQVLRGSARLSIGDGPDEALDTADGVAVSDEPRLIIETSEASELLLFDLA